MTTSPAPSGQPDTASIDSFPRQFARTRRLSLGEPRNLVVSPDGGRIVFIRSRAGDDPINCLFVLDVATGEERLVADPLALLSQLDPDDLPQTLQVHILCEQRSSVPPRDGCDHAVHHSARAIASGAAASIDACRGIEVSGRIEREEPETQQETS